VLTPNNKRITHRNVHPVSPSLPGGSPKAAAWTSIKFHNAFKEKKPFTLKLENISDRRGGLRFIVDASLLPKGADQPRVGFRKIAIDGAVFARSIAHASNRGDMDESVRKLLEAFSEPLVLETENGLSETALADVVIPAGESIPAVIGISPADAQGQARALRFEVTQYDARGIVGGSKFYLAPPPRTGQEVLRVVLEKVQILDDKDPWIFGRGELSFAAEVTFAGHPARGRRVRIPERGILKISDKPGQNIVTFNEILFEGLVPLGDEMTLRLMAIERDVVTKDDRFTRYHRVFRGAPDRWAGGYGPDDEASDPESMSDWRVWLRIERV